MKRTVDALKDGLYDLLILGGGITGAGVALDAALRGYRVALIDKGDFASGTSSASSKLVHGGLRYLEHGNFRLVYEALHERRLLLENAPHLVHPLRFVLPFYRGSRVPPWKWRLGLTLYDLLAGSSNLHRSQPLSLRGIYQEFPDLRREQLFGGAAYFDAQMEDARLCIDVHKTAALAGACVANYVEALGFQKQQGVLTGAKVIDRVGGKEFVIRARQILNATGPWVDHVCRMAGDVGGPFLKPTKGVHLVAPARGFTAAFLLLHPDDGRVFFVIPWHGKMLIGTTDTAADGAVDALQVTGQEIEYLLRGFNAFFQTPLQAGDLLGSFAGLRPLIRSRPTDPSSQTRDFRILRSSTGLLSVAGGKYTTYRHMAEVVTNRIVRRLGRRGRCRTQHYPLDGTPRQPWAQFVAQESPRLGTRHGLAEEIVLVLLHRYGRRTCDVLAYLDRRPELAQPVHPDEPDLCVEEIYQREHEMAIFPADSLLRRSRLGLFHPELLAEMG